MSTVKINEDQYRYEHSVDSYSIISISNKTCTCSYFVDKAMCKHLVRVCIDERLELPGLVLRKKFSIRRRKRKEATISNKSLSIETNNHNNTLEDAEASFSIIQQSIEQPIEQQTEQPIEQQIEQQIVQPAAQSIKHTIEDTQQQTEEVIVQSIEQPIQLPIQVKKMRGRPPKSKQALVND